MTNRIENWQKIWIPVLSLLVALATIVCNAYIQSYTIKSNQKKEAISKLQEIYSNCIYYLSPIERYIYFEKGSPAELEYVKELRKNYREAQRWLNILLVFYPFKDTKEFIVFQNQIRDFCNLNDITGESVKKKALKMRETVINLSIKDKRLKMF